MNGVECPAESEVILQEGDKVRFGTFETEYKLQFIEAVLTTSHLQPKVKNSMLAAAQTLGIPTSGSWSASVSIIVMDKLAPTEKLLFGLVANQTIVSEHWVSLLLEVRAKPTDLWKAWNRSSEYAPPTASNIKIESLASIEGLEVRPKLFKDMWFVFGSNRSHKSFHKIIEMVSGDSCCINVSSLADVTSNEESVRTALSRDCTYVVFPRGKIPSEDTLESLANLCPSRSFVYITDNSIATSVIRCVPLQAHEFKSRQSGSTSRSVSVAEQGLVENTKGTERKKESSRSSSSRLISASSRPGREVVEVAENKKAQSKEVPSLDHQRSPKRGALEAFGRKGSELPDEAARQRKAVCLSSASSAEKKRENAHNSSRKERNRASPAMKQTSIRASFVASPAKRDSSNIQDSEEKQKVGDPVRSVEKPNSKRKNEAADEDVAKLDVCHDDRIEASLTTEAEEQSETKAQPKLAASGTWRKRTHHLKTESVESASKTVMHVEQEDSSGEGRPLDELSIDNVDLKEHVVVVNLVRAEPAASVAPQVLSQANLNFKCFKKVCMGT